MPQILLVGCGTALGALVRFVLTTLLGGGALPLLLINVLGSAVMGYAKPPAFWGTGFLGGFTSFAAFAFLTSGFGPAQAGAYVVATVAGCTAAYLMGDRLQDRGRA
ncbi:MULTISPECIES: fluoride efflux transporter family protein [Corynebacterium]|uniref:fluoride efflux transporter family protein n=1 Tax=Corynebacterium TaxID=1716 RepID=UPI0008A2CBD2|nr:MULTISPECIES: fluoride efflux transporter family protein [Corynebacterium]MBE7339684.1 fluoride efflux transporter family protein [Corynebacterium aurimucosum]OFN21436.1 fluoride ion transporter CrcB [Corynebacterium sp. HMSC055A01]HCT9181460.1 fluoride efflux transporter family protein [Corynebacterium aurimucosum]